MKIFSRTTIILSVFLSLFLCFGQTLFAKENQCGQVTFDYLFTKLKSASSEVGSKEKIIKELKNEIIERKMFTDLNFADEKRLKSVGADDSLFQTIRQNIAKPSKEEADLYNLFVDHYEGNSIEQIKKALDAAKEYVKKFENDGCRDELVKYFKDAIPTLERSLKQILEHEPDREPKTNSKWIILRELEATYKAKNFDKVFALGRKVYEIDPEFVPLFTVLASLGFDQAKFYGNKSKYNAETVFYAELAVNLLENSKKDLSSYGAFEYNYKTKAEALSKMKEILDFMKTQNLYKTKPRSIK